jgi:hypothetical protein
VGDLGHFQVEKLKDKHKLLANSINNQFVLGAENLLEMVLLVLSVTNRHHNRLSSDMVQDVSSTCLYFLLLLSRLCAERGVVVELELLVCLPWLCLEQKF